MINPKYFEVHKSEHICELLINRADKSNALNEEAWVELSSLVKYLDGDKDVRIILLRGKGKNFSAGMDLSTLVSLPQQLESECEARKRQEIRGFIKGIQDCISSIERCSKPVIAAVQGACIGGAMSLVTACDLVYCCDDALFSVREVKLGIVPDIGVLQRMPINVNPAHVAELSYTGRDFDGNFAYGIGLVNASFPGEEKMLEAVRKTAKEIAGQSPMVIQGIKQVLKHRRDHSVEESLDYVSIWNAAYLLGDDLNAAMRAYMAGQKPVFK